ncbi:MAG: ATP-dependent zinc protease [Candidatus Chisholmbacteria bacterium]|nr:ATP-dependent zinc protease [Candidatus Chisholmbacteria bacterium]
MAFRGVLGLNARNHIYSARYNPEKAKRVANSKLLTKSMLKKAKLPVPRLFRVFRSKEEVEKFDFSRLPASFVVKPNRGLGGEGIVVIDKGGVWAGEWVDTGGVTWKVGDLKLHIEDILEGRFSMQGVADIAFVEERIPIHPVLEKYVYQGAPDIRVIVFNRVPVMAMLRLPTRESHGRANLYQGAIGVGIDLATGVTTWGIWHETEVVFAPGTRRKLFGIKVPEWHEVLELAVRCQEETGLGYLGADIVLHPERGPMVLELNAQPGLKIQLCNRAGLLARLSRVEDLKVKSVEHGIRIAQALFADPKVAELTGAGVKTIGVFEDVEVVNLKTAERVKVKAKVDTGAYSSSVDQKLAEAWGLLSQDNVITEKRVRSALGREKRPVVAMTFWLGGKKVKTVATVSDRSNLKRAMIVGRRDLGGFLVRGGEG